MYLPQGGRGERNERNTEETHERDTEENTVDSNANDRATGTNINVSMADIDATNDFNDFNDRPFPQSDPEAASGDEGSKLMPSSTPGMDRGANSGEESENESKHGNENENDGRQDQRKEDNEHYGKGKVASGKYHFISLASEVGDPCADAGATEVGMEGTSSN